MSASTFPRLFFLRSIYPHFSSQHRMWFARELRQIFFLSLSLKNINIYHVSELASNAPPARTLVVPTHPAKSAREKPLRANPACLVRACAIPSIVPWRSELESKRLHAPSCVLPLMECSNSIILRDSLTFQFIFPAPVARVLPPQLLPTGVLLFNPWCLLALSSFLAVPLLLLFAHRNTFALCAARWEPRRGSVHKRFYYFEVGPWSQTKYLPDTVLHFANVSP